MVDAIGTVSNKPIVKSKDASINWQQCTADEIKEYEGQGEDVPAAILAWANEIAKIANAPDDVTYEMVNGSTSIDEINQVLAVTDSANANDKDETDSNTNMNRAQAERSLLQAGGTTLSDQGRIFMNKSASAAGATEGMAGVLEGAIAASANLAASADEVAAQTASETNALRGEYDALVARARDNTSEPLTEAEQARLTALGAQLTQIGTRAQATLAGLDGEAEALRTSVSAFNGIPENALDFGNETTTIGMELMGVSQDKQASVTDKAAAASDAKDGALNVIRNNSKINLSRFLFDADYRLGVTASRQGSADAQTGAEGVGARTSAEAQVDSNVGRVKTAQASIENDTFVGANETPTNTNGDRAQQTETTDETIAKEKDITLADETITTDPNEIQKRKERKGLA